MEATLVWAGVWGSITVSGFLLVPIVLEFFKRNTPICFGLFMTVLGLYILMPYSAGARTLWTPISQIPSNILNALVALFSTLLGGPS